MKIIAIGHYKRVGKDTFADMLIGACRTIDPSLRIIKKSWAWKLKQICFELYAWAGLREPEFYDTKEGEPLREVILPAIGKSPRQIWIDFGTKAVRENVYEGTWRDYLMQVDHNCDVMLLPDTRFFNEIGGVEQKGGHTVKMLRPGYAPGDNKPDRELLEFRGWRNYVFNTSLQELSQQATRYAMWLCGHADEPVADVDTINRAFSMELASDLTVAA